MSAARKEPARSGSSWRDFYDGLSRTTTSSVIGIVAFALLELATLCVIVTPRSIARLDPRRLMENPRDDYAKLTIAALRMRYVRDPGLSLAYMGPSTARLALLHADAPKLIQDYLEAQTGEPVAFHELCSDAQTLEEALILSDQVPPWFRGIVILVVSDTRDDERNKEIRERDVRLHAEAREALESPTDDSYAADQGEELPARTGVYFLDNLKFFAVRRSAFARTARSGDRPAIEGQRRPVTPEEQALWARRMAAGWNFVRNDFLAREQLAILHRYQPLLEKLTSSWHARGIEGVLLEAPINPRYDALKGETYRADYRREMTEFAERVGVQYWDLSDELQFDWRDFADHIHLNERAARFRFQASVLRRSAILLRKMSKHVPPNAEPLEFYRPPKPPVEGQLTLDGPAPTTPPPAADGGPPGAADAGPAATNGDDSAHDAGSP